MNETPETLKDLKNIHSLVAEWLGHELDAHAAAWKEQQQENWDDFSKDDPQAWPQYVHAELARQTADLRADRDALRERVAVLEPLVPAILDVHNNSSFAGGYYVMRPAEWEKIESLYNAALLQKKSRLASLPPEENETSVRSGG